MICVKPKDLEDLIEHLSQFIQKNNVIVSFAAGVKTSSLRDFFKSKLSFVRLMPNLSIKYGESITAVYSDNFSEKEKHNLKKIFLFLVPLFG